jgi:hypothetical protein
MMMLGRFLYKKRTAESGGEVWRRWCSIDRLR